MRRFLVQFPCLLLACIGILSCKKEEYKTIIYDPIEPTWGVPLINSTLTLKDIVTNLEDAQGVSEGPDGFYTFFYSDSLLSDSVGKFLDIPAQSYSQTIAAPAVLPILPSGQSLSGNYSGKENFTYGNGSRLKYIDFDSPTKFTLNFSSKLKHKVDVTLTISSLINLSNNTVYTESFSLDYTGTSPTVFSKIIDLSTYRLALVDGNNYNTFSYSVNYTITGKNNPILAGDDLSFSLDIISPKFKLIHGDLGSLAVDDFNDQIEISIFNNAILGNVFFEDARLKTTFTNTFGIPLSLKVNELKSTTKSGKEVNVTYSDNNGNSIPGNLTVNKAPQINNYTITPSLTVFDFNRNNSNIVDVINPAPNFIKYSFSPNLQGDTSNFITPQSRVKIKMEAEIPVKGRISTLTFGDTSDLFSSVQDSFPNREIIDSVIIKLKITNFLPLDARVQLYFMDEANNIIDSLIPDPSKYLIPTAEFNSSGQVTKERIERTDIVIGAKRYDDKIYRARKIAFIVNTQTPSVGGTPVNIKLYSYNFLQVQLSVLAKATIKID